MQTQPAVDENALILQAQNTDQLSLKNLLDRLGEAYHNATALVSDATYDKLVDIYEAKFGEYTMIGAVPRGEKEDLPNYRSGLRKVTEEKELLNYERNFPGDYVLMDKIDGLNLEYILTISPEGVRNEKLLTRGDGTVGKNVTHIIPYLNIPKLNADIDVIGEVYVPIEAFNRVGKAYGFKNARNMASGIVNSKDSFNPTLAKELRFRGFEIENSTETPEQQVLRLATLGFQVPNPIKTPNLSMELLEQVYLQRKASAEYDMDGEVIYQNRYVQSPVGEKPRHIVAFKMPEEAVETTVTGVTWEASKNLLLKPVIHYQPVNWKGGEAVLQKASGDNARFIVTKGIGPGARIMVTRSGDVIPRVVAVLQPVQPSIPTDRRYAWNENQVEFVLLEEDDEVRAAKIESFFDKLGIEHLGPARTKDLVRAGLKSIQAILLATPDQLAYVLGPTVGPNAYYDMHMKTQNVPLPTLMAASGVFPNIGETLFKDLYKAYPSMILWWKCDPNQIAQAFLQVKGFKKRAYEIASKMSSFGDWLMMHPMITVEQAQVQPQVQAQAEQVCPTGTLLTVNTNVAQIPQIFTGKTIVFTLVRDAPLQKTIEDRGGKVTSKASRNTNYVITNNLNGDSASLQTARQYRIPIMTPEQFRAQFNI